MILKIFFSLAVSFLTGYFCFSLIRKEKQLITPILVNFIISFAIGTGISSALFFLWLLITGEARNFCTAEAVVVLILFFAVLARKKEVGLKKMFAADNFKSLFTGKTNIFFMLGIGVLVIINSLSFLFFFLNTPYGKTDAINIWNLKARFFYLSSDYHWLNVFTNYSDLTHPDYPLLLPSYIARTWEYAGQLNQAVPGVIAFLFTMLTVFLLVAAVRHLRGNINAMVAGIYLLISPSFIIIGASQVADTVIGLYFLATTIILYLQKTTEKAQSLLVIAGLTAGFSAWTKNEGIIFILAVIVCRFLFFIPKDGLRKVGKDFLSFLYGLCPVLLPLILFKIYIAPANDLFAAKNDLIPKVLDVERYFLIIKVFVHEFLNYVFQGFFPFLLLMIFVTVSGITGQKEEKNIVTSCAQILLLMLFSYAAVYLISPHPLDWHLDTSATRLLIQLYPSFLFILLVSAAPKKV